MSDMTILSNSLGVSSTAGTTSTTEDNTTLSTEDFYTLLLTQLQNQDPLNPMDTGEMTSQISSISSLEFQDNTNALLESLVEKIDSQGDNDLVNYIGKEVTLSGNTLAVDGETQTEGFFTIYESADVSVSIYDNEGNKIQQLSLGYREAGQHDIAWDGTDFEGEAVADGNYTFEVTALNATGGQVDATTGISAVVNAVNYNYDQAYLKIGSDLMVDPSIIEQVA